MIPARPTRHHTSIKFKTKSSVNRFKNMAGKTVEKVLPSCISLPLQPEVLDEIVSKAKDYALMHGICMRSKVNYNPDSLQVSESAKMKNPRSSRKSLSKQNTPKSCTQLITTLYHHSTFILVRPVCADSVDLSTLGIWEGHKLADSFEWTNSQCCSWRWLPQGNARKHHQSRWLHRRLV